MLKFVKGLCLGYQYKMILYVFSKTEIEQSKSVVAEPKTAFSALKISYCFKLFFLSAII